MPGRPGSSVAPLAIVIDEVMMPVPASVPPRAHRHAGRGISAIEHHGARGDVGLVDAGEIVCVSESIAGAGIEIERVVAAGADDIAGDRAAGDVEHVRMRRQLHGAGEEPGGLIDGDGARCARGVDRGAAGSGDRAGVHDRRAAAESNSGTDQNAGLGGDRSSVADIACERGNRCKRNTGTTAETAPLLVMPPEKLVTPDTRMPAFVPPADSVPALEMPPVKVGPEILMAVAAEVIWLAPSIRMPWLEPRMSAVVDDRAGDGRMDNADRGLRRDRAAVGDIADEGRYRSDRAAPRPITDLDADKAGRNRAGIGDASRAAGGAEGHDAVGEDRRNSPEIVPALVMPPKKVLSETAMPVSLALEQAAAGIVDSAGEGKSAQRRRWRRCLRKWYRHC